MLHTYHDHFKKKAEVYEMQCARRRPQGPKSKFRQPSRDRHVKVWVGLVAGANQLLVIDLELTTAGIYMC